MMVRSFTKINQLRPGAFGLNLTVKVVNSKAIQTRGGRNGTQGRNMRLAECLNKQEHEEHLKLILELLKKEELYAKFSKYESGSYPKSFSSFKDRDRKVGSGS
ncbi:hypothetical protein Tco_0538640 [Tanacetum coccineum]